MNSKIFNVLQNQETTLEWGMHSDFRSSWAFLRPLDELPNGPAGPNVGNKNLLYFVGSQADDYQYAFLEEAFMLSYPVSLCWSSAAIAVKGKLINLLMGDEMTAPICCVTFYSWLYIAVI